MMKINVRDICGHSYILSLPNEASVSDACHCLSEMLNISENNIFFVSPNENYNFYHSSDSMLNVMKENPDYIIYTKCFNSDCSYLNQNNSSSQLLSSLKKSKYQVPNKILFKLICLKNASRKYNKKDPIYLQYSKCFTEVPDDLQQKIDEIAVLGYKIEDIKEALRNSGYNILFAINSLVCRNSNKHENIQDEQIIGKIQNKPQTLQNPIYYSSRIKSSNSFGKNPTIKNNLSYTFGQWGKSSQNSNLHKWRSNISNTNSRPYQWKNSTTNSNNTSSNEKPK